jgi:hypothetical protein
MEHLDRRQLLRLVSLIGALTASEALTVGNAAAATKSVNPSDNPEVQTKYLNSAPPLAKPASSTRLDTSDLRKPLQQDPREWEETVNSLHNHFSLTNRLDNGRLKTKSVAEPLPSQYSDIATGFRYRPLHAEPLNFLQVEGLLQECANLLDRGMKTRSEWSNLSVRAFTTGLDLVQFAQLDDVHQEEIAAGFYTLNYQQSAFELQENNADADAALTARAYLSYLLSNQYSQAEMLKQNAIAQLEAWISTLPAFVNDLDDDKTGGLANFTFSGVTKTKPESMKDAASDRSWYSLTISQLLYQVEQAERQGQVQVASLRTRASAAKRDWEFKDAGFRRERTEIARSIAQQKLRAAIAPGAPLNYAERMIPLQKRFTQDFREALDRAFVVAMGLNVVYGYSEPLPPSVQRIGNHPSGSSAVFDDCLIWVREAVNWLVRFGRLEQNYVLPISLRAVLENADWKKGLSNGIWDFEITEEFFPNQCHVRLRGISAFVHGADLKGVWQVQAHSPKRSYFHHLDGSKRQVDQSFIPPCFLGRVATRDDIRAPDIAGVTALRNVSPIGRWRVSFGSRSSEGVPLSTIENVTLDLQLAVRYSA